MHLESTLAAEAAVASAGGVAGTAEALKAAEAAASLDRERGREQESWQSALPKRLGDQKMGAGGTSKAPHLLLEVHRMARARSSLLAVACWQLLVGSGVLAVACWQLSLTVAAGLIAWADGCGLLG